MIDFAGYFELNLFLEAISGEWEDSSGSLRLFEDIG